ncbi:MAG TPA: biopolymer transporter ExbD, partial [Candidatus Omnitrophota bacterium]|nr:biopolymer transporter ExbD [Candidatus Omnitrophota bacterium]
YFIIIISSENVIYHNDAVLTLEELNQRLQDLRGRDIPVLIKADRRASLGRMVDVWDICRKYGIERINIATTQDR